MPFSKTDEDYVWHTVASGEMIKFSFEEQGFLYFLDLSLKIFLMYAIYNECVSIIEKRRHRDSHMVKHHQITVKVSGWKPVKPVSVDRVGVYFRLALPDNCSLVHMNSFK